MPSCNEGEREACRHATWKFDMTLSFKENLPPLDESHFASCDAFVLRKELYDDFAEYK